MFCHPGWCWSPFCTCTCMNQGRWCRCADTDGPPPRTALTLMEVQTFPFRHQETCRITVEGRRRWGLLPPHSLDWKTEIRLSIWLKLATRWTCSEWGSLPMVFRIFMSTRPTPIAKIWMPAFLASAATSFTVSWGLPSVTIIAIRGMCMFRGRAPWSSVKAVSMVYWMAKPVMVPVARCSMFFTACSTSALLPYVLRENSGWTTLPYCSRPTRVASWPMSRNCSRLMMKVLTFS